MKRTLLLLVAGVAISGLTGCMRENCCGNGQCCNNVPGGDPMGQQCVRHGNPDDPSSCPSHLCPFCGGRGCPHCCANVHATPAPVTGAVTYPYYTLHGPRDYFDASPSSLGP